jgi:hypothetical protein
MNLVQWLYWCSRHPAFYIRTKELGMTSRTAFGMSAFVFTTLRWVITQSINNAQGGDRVAEPMNCVAKDLEARALSDQG